MGGEIAQPLAQIVGPCNHTTLGHDHRPNGHFVHGGGGLCFLEGHGHEPDVFLAEIGGSGVHQEGVV